MKYFLLLIVVIAGIVWIRQQNAKTRTHAEALVEDTSATPVPAAAPEPPSQRKVTYMPSLGRYVEHDSKTSPMQSIGGGGGGGGGSRATPAVSSGERDLRKKWGWDTKGSALNQPAR